MATDVFAARDGLRGMFFDQSVEPKSGTLRTRLRSFSCLIAIAVVMVWGASRQQLPAALLLSFFPARRLGKQQGLRGTVAIAVAAGAAFAIADGCLNTASLADWLSQFAIGLLLVLICHWSDLEQVERTRLQGTDALTGLLNRRGIEARLESMLYSRAEQSSITVACVDCDDFKLFNDTQGHRAGDDFLIQAARVFAAVSPSRTLAARLGGDEFCCVWLGIAPEDARQEVDELSELLREHGSRWDPPLHWSIGASWFPTSMGIRDLLDEADHLMLTAKRTQKGSLIFAMNPQRSTTEANPSPSSGD